LGAGKMINADELQEIVIRDKDAVNQAVHRIAKTLK
jgi:hypothetical protein